MKTKTITNVIRRKMEFWWNSIKDEELRARVRENTIVTGGAIASMLLGEKVNDWDVYMRDRGTAIDIARYYVKQLAQSKPERYRYFENKNHECAQLPGAIYIMPFDDRIKIVVKSIDISGKADPDRAYRYFERDNDVYGAAQYIESVAEEMQPEPDDKTKGDYHAVFITSNCITLSGGVQIVTRFFGEPEEIHRNYDFQHCICWWGSWDKELHTPERALTALLARELVYVGSRYPICSMFRVRKFLQRGFRITAGQIVKMAWQIAQLDLNDFDILEDQLTGVDAAYFNEIISLLKEDAEKRGTKKVDDTYLFQLIDKIF